MVMRSYPARLENMIAQVCKKRSICRGAMHERMPRWVDHASLVRIEHFERRGKSLRKDRQQIEEKRRGVVGKEGQNNGSCVVFMNPIPVLAGQPGEICA